jgi:MFS family permease
MQALSCRGKFVAASSMFATLKSLKGNARTLVLTEPLWAIPYNLFMPYVSIYMLNLGVTDRQIGSILTINWCAQFFCSIFSGIITDKLGRKWTTVLGDLMAWSISCLIWAISQNFAFFVVAAVSNAFWRFPMTSWTCLLVEDTDPERLLDVYTWIYVAGLLAAFFVPLAGLFVQMFSLIPTMRVLYLLGFVLMSTKFTIMALRLHETDQGRQRIHETRHKSVLAMLLEYKSVIGLMLSSSRTLYLTGIAIVMSICTMINNSFWSIIVIEKIHIPTGNLAVFPFFKSIIMFVCYFWVIPRLTRVNLTRPMFLGFASFLLSHLILLLTPEKGYAFLFVSALLEAFSVATLGPLIERTVALTAEPQERARIISLVYLLVIVCTAPFGWIAGALSSVNRSLPFLLTISLFAVGCLLVYLSSRPAPIEKLEPVESVSQTPS